MVILTTGGRSHSTSDPKFGNMIVPETAALAKAGFVPVSANTVLQGAGGAWTASLAEMGLSGTAGHLGLVSSFDSSVLENDYLYRVGVPGHPEYNEMSVTLDMTDHDIINVKSLRYEPHTLADMNGGTFCTSADDEGRTFLDADNGLYLCRNQKTVLISDSGNSLALQEARLVSTGALIDKPVCADGAGLHPEIFVTPSVAATGAESPAIAALQSWATDFSDEQWQVHLRIKNSRDVWIYPSSSYGRMVVYTSCARD
jgi:hypothetical protein